MKNRTVLRSPSAEKERAWKRAVVFRDLAWLGLAISQFQFCFPIFGSAISGGIAIPSLACAALALTFESSTFGVSFLVRCRKDRGLWDESASRSGTLVLLFWTLFFLACRAAIVLFQVCRHSPMGLILFFVSTSSSLAFLGYSGCMAKRARKLSVPPPQKEGFRLSPESFVPVLFKCFQLVCVVPFVGVCLLLISGSVAIAQSVLDVCFPGIPERTKEEAVDWIRIVFGGGGAFFFALASKDAILLAFPRNAATWCSGRIAGLLAKRGGAAIVQDGKASGMRNPWFLAVVVPLVVGMIESIDWQDSPIPFSAMETGMLTACHSESSSGPTDEVMEAHHPENQKDIEAKMSEKADSAVRFPVSGNHDRTMSISNSPAQRASYLNQEMDRNLAVHNLSPDYATEMIATWRDRANDELVRNFAVQHLERYARECVVRGTWDPDSPDAEDIRAALEEAVRETDTSVGGAALLALARLSEIDPNVDRARLGSRAAAVLSDSAVTAANRVSAAQVCGLLRVRSALPALRALSSDPATPTPLRLAAERAVQTIEED